MLSCGKLVYSYSKKWVRYGRPTHLWWGCREDGLFLRLMAGCPQNTGLDDFFLCVPWIRTYMRLAFQGGRAQCLHETGSFVGGAVSIWSPFVSTVSYSERRSMNSFSNRWTLRFEAMAGRMSSLKSLCFFIPYNKMNRGNSEIGQENQAQLIKALQRRVGVPSLKRLWLEQKLDYSV